MINDKIAIQPELLFSYGNIRNLEIQSENKLISNYYRLMYIKIPVLFNYQFSDKIYGEIGPELQLFQEGYLTVKDFETDKNVKSTRLKELHTFQYNLNLGAGYHFNNRWNTGFRFSWGLTSIAKSLDYNIKVFNISLGLNYTLK